MVVGSNEIGSFGYTFSGLGFGLRRWAPPPGGELTISLGDTNEWFDRAASGGFSMRWTSGDDLTDYFSAFPIGVRTRMQ